MKAKQPHQSVLVLTRVVAQLVSYREITTWSYYQSSLELKKLIKLLYVYYSIAKSKLAKSWYTACWSSWHRKKWTTFPFQWIIKKSSVRISGPIKIYFVHIYIHTYFTYILSIYNLECVNEWYELYNVIAHEGWRLYVWNVKKQYPTVWEISKINSQYSNVLIFKNMHECVIHDKNKAGKLFYFF